MKRFFATFAAVALLTMGTGCCHHLTRPCGPCASAPYGAAPGYATAMAQPVSVASAAPMSYAAAPATGCDCNVPAVAPY
ncbi:hypothetical protein [Thalassoroseus pseudoceratinae]|uniref:hypothetical protein n=1 Tax=Thalassoroseus pseudoceratinae TaxID=2713176 RepID=UPI00141E9A07|nr:hypothetical protein [Thalassoroseus pseudoceratinae]